MNKWYLLGTVLQGTMLGVLVVVALLLLLGFQADERLFRYQGY